MDRSFAHGIFDIDSMLIYFFSPNGKHEIDYSRSYFEPHEGAYAKYNQQTYTAKSVFVLAKKISINISHELVHSWQALSSPMIILNFLNLSKRLRANAEKLNFYKPRISNTYLFLDDKDPEIEFCYRSHRMNFIQRKNGRELFKQIKKIYENWLEQGFASTWKDFAIEFKSRLESKYGLDIYDILGPDLDMVRNSYNVVSDENPIAMPLLWYKHEYGNQYFVAFGALIDFFDLVYFTGDNLMEAFAYINDCLRKKIKIPQYNSLNSEDNMYLGVYEFYRRIHGKRYKSEEELAISFLALVDLALVNDPFGCHSDVYENDEAFRQENVSLPYRFGCLVYRAKGFKPFIIENDDILSSIKKWQDEYCKYLGFFAVDDCIKNTLSYMLKIILNDGNIYYQFPNC